MVHRLHKNNFLIYDVRTYVYTDGKAYAVLMKPSPDQPMAPEEETVTVTIAITE